MIIHSAMDHLVMCILHNCKYDGSNRRAYFKIKIKSKSLSINLHHVFSTVTMDDPAVFTNLIINTLGVTNQQTIYVITKNLDYFGDLLDVNDGDIGTFVKDTYSSNNTRAIGQRILISNNVTQGIKSMFFG